MARMISTGVGRVRPAPANEVPCRAPITCRALQAEEGTDALAAALRRGVLRKRGDGELGPAADPLGFLAMGGDLADRLEQRRVGEENLLEGGAVDLEHGD